MLRLGLVGTGNIAHEHMKVLRAMDGVEVSSVYSRTRAKAEQFASEWGISNVVDEASSIYEAKEIDGLLVLVSADQIFNVASSAVSYGTPVFIEKPPGLNPSETLSLAQRAKEFNTPTMVGFNRRYYSNFLQGIDIIRQKGSLLGVLVEGHERFARVRSANVHPETILESWLYANSTHTIDLLRFFGGEIEEIHSFGKSHKETNGDQFTASMRFQTGAIGTYIAHWYSPGGWRVVLYGEDVTVEFKPLEQGIYVGADYKTHQIKIGEKDKMFKPGFYGQIEAFCKMVSTGELEWPALDLWGAYKSMCLAESISAKR